MTFYIRPARPSDQGTLRRIVRRASLGPFGLHWSNFLIAESDGEIIGVGQVKSHRDGSRELASLAVVPTYQGQGIGSALVRALLHREEGVVFLFCRIGLRGFYRQFGFAEAAPGDLSPSIRRLLRLIHAGTWLLYRLTARRLTIIAMHREPGP